MMSILLLLCCMVFTFLFVLPPVVRATHFVWLQPIHCGIACTQLTPTWDYLPNVYLNNSWEIRFCESCNMAFGIEIMMTTMDTNSLDSYSSEKKKKKLQLYDGPKNNGALMTWIEKNSPITDEYQMHRNFDMIYKLEQWKDRADDEVSPMWDMVQDEVQMNYLSIM